MNFKTFKKFLISVVPFTQQSNISQYSFNKMNSFVKEKKNMRKYLNFEDYSDFAMVGYWSFKQQQQQQQKSHNTSTASTESMRVVKSIIHLL